MAEKELTGRNEERRTLAKLEEVLRENAEKRQKEILRREVPEKRTLANGLMTLTRPELEDICYNVGLSSADKQSKAELVETLVPAVTKFAGEWFVSMFDEQYQAMRHIAQREGLSTQFRTDEARLDYFQSIGVVLSGAYHGRPAWYMPDEILAEFRELDGSAFAKLAEWNTEIFRIAAGLLFYYGVLDHDQLFSKVKRYTGEDDLFRFVDFMRILLNGVCWKRNVAMSERFAYYYTVLNPQKTWDAQKELAVGYARLSYPKVYEAGEENYIEATDAYKALAQFFMRAFGADVLKAADITGEITILFQNGGLMPDVLKYITTLGTLDTSHTEELDARLRDFYHSLRLWNLKGHTPKEIATGKLDSEDEEGAADEKRRRKKKPGRNDPCPCGSGKKYKNCCLRKETSEETDAAADESPAKE